VLVAELEQPAVEDQQKGITALPAQVKLAARDATHPGLTLDSFEGLVAIWAGPRHIITISVVRVIALVREQSLV
jgi:hypothetical protein